MLGETLTGVLRITWATVEQLGLPAAVMGGIALTAWLHPRNIRDVDLLLGTSSTDPDTLLREMQAHGFRPMRFPALVEIEPALPPGRFTVTVAVWVIAVVMLPIVAVAETIFSPPAVELRVPM